MCDNIYIETKPESDTIKTTFALITIEETVQPLSDSQQSFLIWFRLCLELDWNTGEWVYMWEDGIVFQFFFYICYNSKGNNYTKCNIIKQTPYGVFL